MHRFLTLSQGASQTRTTPDAEFAGNDLFFQTDRGAKRQRKDTGKRMLRCVNALGPNSHTG